MGVHYPHPNGLLDSQVRKQEYTVQHIPICNNMYNMFLFVRICIIWSHEVKALNPMFICLKTLYDMPYLMLCDMPCITFHILSHAMWVLLESYFICYAMYDLSFLMYVVSSEYCFHGILMLALMMTCMHILFSVERLIRFCSRFPLLCIDENSIRSWAWFLPSCQACYIFIAKTLELSPHVNFY